MKPLKTEDGFAFCHCGRKMDITVQFPDHSQFTLNDIAIDIPAIYFCKCDTCHVTYDLKTKCECGAWLAFGTFMAAYRSKAFVCGGCGRLYDLHELDYRIELPIEGAWFIYETRNSY